MLMIEACTLGCNSNLSVPSEAPRNSTFSLVLINDTHVHWRGGRTTNHAPVAIPSGCDKNSKQ